MRYRFLMLQLLYAGNDSAFYRFNTTVDLFSCTEPVYFAQTFCTCTDKGYEASPFLWRYFPDSGKSLNEDQKSEMKGLDRLVWKDRRRLLCPLRFLQILQSADTFSSCHREKTASPMVDIPKWTDWHLSVCTTDPKTFTLKYSYCKYHNRRYCTSA